MPSRIPTTIAFSLLIACGVPGWSQVAGDLVSRVYQVEPATVATLAAELRQAFQADPSIRIAADPETGRMVIVAPPQVHQDLVPIMRDAGDSSGGSSRRVATSADGEPRTIPLRHYSANKLRTTILRLYHGSVPAQCTPDGTAETLTVGSGTEQRIRLTLDYAANAVKLEGSAAATGAWARVIGVLDQPRVARNEQTELVAAAGARPASVQRAMELINRRANHAGQRPAKRTDIVQWDKEGIHPRERTPREIAQATPPNEGRGVLPANSPAANGEDPEGLLGPVQIEYLDGLDVIVLRGKKEDVERVNKIIREIEELSVVTEPAIEVVDLQHVDSEAIAEIIRPLQDEVLSVRQGRVSITPLVKPNALLLLGRPESVKVVKTLIEKLDRPAEPDEQFHVFQLQYLSASEAEETINNFYEERGGLGTKVRVVSDFRSNAIIVQASPRDAAEVRKLLMSLDVAKGAAVNEVRVFHLKNSLAEDLVPILEEALKGSSSDQPAGETSTGRPASTLSLATVDAKGKRLYQSGVLADVQVTADPRSNTVVVRGPAESMDLIAALIRQLDELPAEDAEIKVFTIVNGDAVLLAEVLQELFGNQLGTGFQGGQANSIASNALIPLRFTVDERTNSIVASGSLADLRVVEAILLRLDEEDVEQRKSVVYRLRYAPAIDVATAINEFLRSERQIQDVAPATVSPFQQIEREVVVVPEPVSNSLIVSATPRYFDEINQIVQELDARPPMVMIQVLIAEVDLTRFCELGTELGIQDPLLFDRSVVTSAMDMSAELIPGFDFNNAPLGNSASDISIRSAGMIGAQTLGNFGLGRINNELGFGGLVLSASSDALSVLIRALEVDTRMQVLSRPQIMTLDNQPAFVQVGQRVPRITSSQLTINGTINNTVLENVGLLLGVTPRISPDGLVVMEINAEKSKLGPQDEGIPISISAGGDVIFSPIIDIITAQTTVSARSGQTVVIGGLISEADRQFNRGVPFLSGIPVLGDLFRYEQDRKDRFELLFILTPYIVRGEQDVNCINQMESDRMSWCLSDVYRVHGYFDVNACESFSDGTVPGQGGGCPATIYPDRNPAGLTDANDTGRNAYQSAPPYTREYDSPGELAPTWESVPVNPAETGPLPSPLQQPQSSLETRGVAPVAYQELVPRVPARNPRGQSPYVVKMQPSEDAPQTFVTRNGQWVRESQAQP